MDNTCANCKYQPPSSKRAIQQRETRTSPCAVVASGRSSKLLGALAAQSKTVGPRGATVAARPAPPPWEVPKPVGTGVLAPTWEEEHPLLAQIAREWDQQEREALDRLVCKQGCAGTVKVVNYTDFFEPVGEVGSTVTVPHPQPPPDEGRTKHVVPCASLGNDGTDPGWEEMSEEELYFLTVTVRDSDYNCSPTGFTWLKERVEKAPPGALLGVKYRQCFDFWSCRVSAFGVEAYATMKTKKEAKFVAGNQVRLILRYSMRVRGAGGAKKKSKSAGKEGAPDKQKAPESMGGNGQKGNSFIDPKLLAASGHSKSKSGGAPTSRPEDKAKADVFNAKEAEQNAADKAAKKKAKAEAKKAKKAEAESSSSKSKDSQGEKTWKDVADSGSDKVSAFAEISAARRKQAQEEEAENEYKGVCDEQRRGFVHSAPPEFASLSLDPMEATENYDCHGAPYCGLVCIDIGTGKTPNLRDYQNMVSKDNIATPWDEVGTEDALAAYAHSRGVNLIIFRDGAPIFVSPNNHTRWISLNFKQPQVFDGDEDQNPVGHYTLRLCKRADDSRIRIQAFPERETYDWISAVGRMLTGAGVCLGGLLLATVTPSMIVALPITVAACGLKYGLSGLLRLRYEALIVEQGVAPDNRDVRSIPNRRDHILYQDTYSTVRVTLAYSFAFRPWAEVPRCLAVAVEYFTQPALVGDYHISDTLYLNVFNEMEQLSGRGRDPMLALESISRFREVNTAIDSGIIYNTTVILRMMGERLTRSGRVIVAPFTVAVAPPGTVAHIPNIDVILDNQARGFHEPVVGGRGIANHVVRYTLDVGSTDKRVAVAPIGPLYTDEGPVGPGFFAVTDSSTVFAAFCGRAMSKEYVQKSEFVEWGKKFLDHYIDNTDISSLGHEPDGDTIFRTNYKGKRPVAWIETMVSDYEDYTSGWMSAKQAAKYQSNSFFVKFEKNAKKKNGKYKPRPRGIMTMSDYMCYVCAGCLNVIDCWNHGPFGKFQVKGMSRDEMAQKIMSKTNSPYSVSDYSAFESSIDEEMRELENYVMTRLLIRAGWKRTLRAFCEHVGAYRLLRTKWGTFAIGTRCSGDFWTSFGNGILNVTVMAYCAHLKGLPFDMLAEGDDGLIDSAIPDVEIISSIGLSFSAEARGTQDGDCDFLQRRVVGGKWYMPVGKTLCSSMWVKKGHLLRKSKAMAVWRCMAHSLYHMSPGHPVITALVNRIWRETAGYNSFKGINTFFEAYKDFDITDPGLKRVEVDETMRAVVAAGAIGFPPISVALQVELERRIEFDEQIYIGRLLDDDPDVEAMAHSLPSHSKCQVDTEEFFALVTGMQEFANFSVGQSASLFARLEAEVREFQDAGA